MRLYFIVVRRWWIVAVALGLLGLVCWALGGTEVPVPSYLGGMAGTRLEYFTPLLVILAVLYCLERRFYAAEPVAVVSVAAWDHTVLTVTVVLAHLIGLAVGMDISRNLMALLAVALVVRRFGNEAAAGATCLLLLLVVASLGRTYGPTGHMSAHAWALTLQPSGSVSAWLVAAVIFVLALPVSGLRRHSLAERSGE